MGISTERIDEFLDKLNDDEVFRSALVNYTASVLDEYGIKHDRCVIPSEVQLPDVGEVNANRDAFREALFPENAYLGMRPWFKLSPNED